MADLGGGRGWLNDGPAASIRRIDAALGHRMQITEAGRTWAQQNVHYQRYLKYGSPIALKPGTSLHEKGSAIDTNEGQNHIALLQSHGWRRTVYRNGKLVEPWHFEYFPNEDKYRGSSTGGSASGGPSITAVQNWLNTNLGAGLAVDGQDGPATQAAVKRYQAILGVGQDGIWGAGTEAAHRKAHPANALYGGPWVRAIQDKLNRLGYKVGAADGLDGANTQNAVRDFQSKNGLTADGVAGPATNAKMDIALSGGSSSGGPLTVDGKLGPATVALLQTRLGVTADGDWGPATTKALQLWLGVTADGELGPKTYSALQQAVGAPVDGQMGPNTISALQRSLNAGGFAPKGGTPTTPTPTPTPGTKLDIDGQWGPNTIKAFQKRVGSAEDGQLGPNTWKAFQTIVGVTADGEVGPNTAKALQINVGATVDGAIGPDTIRKLQEFLNTDKKFTKVDVPADPKPVEYPKPLHATYPDSVWWDHSSNSSPRRAGDKVQYFVIHHAATTSSVESLRQRFMTANDRKVSPNWLIGSDGSVSEIVPPDNFRAWTSGQFDYNAVTVETQNTSLDPSWGISEASHIAIAKLVAWASKRYNFPIDRTHVIGHRETPGAATICPGPSMDLNRIVALAKGFANEQPVDPKPEDPKPTDPETPKDEWTITLPKDEAIALAGLLDKLRDLLP
ncbi:endolysin [Microbacterium phage Zooman]|nr:endolysin [Microbacterium phage Zooman]